MPEDVKPAQFNFAVIDGSAGFRSLLSAFLLTEWPDACIEEVDPFAETLRGLGLTFGTDSDIVLLGGIGTDVEAIAALQRLLARDHCPPVVLMIARELEPQAANLIAAGAASILFKDAFSRSSLIESVSRLVTGPGDGDPRAPYPDTQSFGQFSFIAAGQCHSVAIDGFRFVATVAGSNLAQVFSAERITDRKRVVIKIALSTPHHDASIRTFCERYRFISSLNGRNVVRYLDAGVTDAWPYVVLEFLSSGDLRRRMAAGITPADAVRTLHRIAGALTTFHAGGFAHMDVKPENIFSRGEEIVLIDFNISTRFGNVARNRITGDVLGSPFYMSPEQGQGLAIDGRSDLYSAGVILFEMLTGNQPYAGESAIQVIYKHIHDEIPLLPKRVRAFQPVVDALMAKNRDERLASGAELATMLLPFLQADGAPDDDTPVAAGNASN